MNSQTNHSGAVGVEVRELRKSFNGAPVLKGISLEVNPGEIFVIMGPSGSGKSVLLKHMIGLEQPDGGDILINGKSVLTTAVLKEYRIAMVFQSGGLLNSLTVGENVGLYLSEHRLKPQKQIDQIVAEKLELVGLRGLESRHPSELSGGMKKRVAIARALAMEPQLILYDEPTSELDPLMAITIAEEIVKLNERLDVTSIVVSHDRDLAFGVSERMAILHEGEIIAAGAPDVICQSSDPLIRRFLTAEFKSRNV